MLDDSILKKLKRGPQVILPKDAGAIAAFTALGSGDRVVEAGTGSGWLTVFIANIVGSGGKVYSYERRKEFLELARKNLEKTHLLERVELKEKDVFNGIDEQEVDLVVLDLADSEKAVLHAFNALRAGGKLVGYHPHVEQVQKFTSECKKTGFGQSQVIEVNTREWLVREQGARPANTGLTHTAFLSFSTKPSPLK